MTNIRRRRRDKLHAPDAHHAAITLPLNSVILHTKAQAIFSLKPSFISLRDKVLF